MEEHVPIENYNGISSASSTYLVVANQPASQPAPHSAAHSFVYFVTNKSKTPQSFVRLLSEVINVFRIFASSQWNGALCTQDCGWTN